MKIVEMMIEIFEIIDRLSQLMTSQMVERTRIRTGGYRRFRGEWVKREKAKNYSE